MGRQTSKLNALTVQRLNRPGLHSDGAGLYLQISIAGTKSWIFRFTLNGRAREMGLGPLAIVSLNEARLKAIECRKQLLDGVDPIDERREKKKQKALDAAKNVTFEECAAAYIKAHQAGWKNAKHASQWESTLEMYAGPVIGKLPVQKIDTALVMKILEPIWYTKAETASRLRGRIELVLGWATVRGFRAGDNPARWRGHLATLLPKRSSVQKIKHFAAIPVTEIGAFMGKLRQETSISARALEFLILTAARTNEVLGAKWLEINLDDKTWIIPAERMKAKREHRVPLSDASVAVLEQMRSMPMSEYVFPGLRPGSPLSNMALLAVLRRLKCKAVSHGFRSTFRDWTSERTNFSREVAEMALAHTVSDKVEAAYRRGDLFMKRRRLMDDWAKFCGTPSIATGSVVAIREGFG